MPQELNAVVTQRIEVAPGLIILRVAPDGWELPEFQAGQFTVLGLPGSAPRADFSDPEPEPPAPDKLIRRAYSIASSSREQDYLEFYITLVRSGELTPRLFALKVGDPVFLNTKISGLFTLRDVPKDSDLVLIATGTGLAPYMSMLRGEIDCHAGHRTAVILGAYHSWDLGYRGELIDMQRFCETFDFIPVISAPEQEVRPWSGHTGFIQELWKNGVIEETWGRKPTPETTHILLCGNPKMIEAMLEVLGEEGFTEHTRKQPGQIHLEKFW